MKNWIAYRLSPIDHLWEMLPTVKDIAEKLADGNRNRLHFLLGDPIADGDFCGSEVMPLDEFLSDLSDAQHLARRAGWEGDYRSDETRPRVLWLPEPDCASFTYAFVWKQDNNGSTFVVSARLLDWLGEYDVAYPDEPERPYALRDFLASKGVPLQVMIEAGLVIAGEDVAVPYDAPGMPKPRCNGAKPE